MKKNKGITLIALVVTISILVTLTIVSVNIALGENGLINNAQKTKIEYTHASVWDGMTMEYTTYMIKYKKVFKGTFIEYLQARNIISTEPILGGYVINTEKLLGEKADYGNGTDGINDVYKLEEITTGIGNKTKLASTKEVKKLADEDSDDDKYRVKYYGDSGDKDLGVLDSSLLDMEEIENINITMTNSTDTSFKYYGGDTIDYVLKVKNTGNVPLKNVMIEEVITALTGTYKLGDRDIHVKDNDRVKCKYGKFIIDEIGVNETITIEYSYLSARSDGGGKVISEIKSFTSDPQVGEQDGAVIPPVEVYLNEFDSRVHYDDRPR